MDMAHVAKRSARSLHRERQAGRKVQPRRSPRPQLQPEKTDRHNAGYYWWLVERDYFGFH